MEKIVEKALLVGLNITTNVKKVDDIDINESMEELKELAKAAKKYNPDAESTAGIQDAVNKAFALAEEDENYVILAFGSLSFIGALTDAVKKQETKNN